MARLEDMLPPGEIVRWRSPKPSWWSFSGDALAVTEARIVWVGGGKGKVALRNIDVIDAEEGGASLNLHVEGETHRIEEIGDVEGAARAAARPARIWRECKSRGAVLARRWRMRVGGIAAAITASAIFGLGYLMFGADAVRGFSGAVTAGIGGWLAYWVAGMAKRTLPHLLVGRTLSGEDRRDFVGWLTDLRWQGVKPDGPGDARLPRSRLEGWAMRLAYGETPDIGEREPDILIPGAFPPDPDGADTT